MSREPVNSRTIPFTEKFRESIHLLGLGQSICSYLHMNRSQILTANNVSVIQQYMNVLT